MTVLTSTSLNQKSLKLRSILKTRTEPGKYFCQCSEFLKCTLHLSGVQRIKKCFSAVAARNISAWGMVKRILVLMWWKFYTKLIGQHARGTQQKTLTEFLGLQAGEVVEVRLLREIVAR